MANSLRDTPDRGPFLAPGLRGRISERTPGRATDMCGDFTVGVEEEYQLVDAETAALRSRARDVLVIDWSDEIRPELQETTLEIGTRICNSAAEVERELKRLRFQVATAAATEGLEIVAAGMHPFSTWTGQVPASGARYREILARYGRTARDEHIFGMHVHVGVPQSFDRIRLLNVVRHYVPHLLALSCSSPFFEGEDSEYASFRMILWRRWPNSGTPPRLESGEEYRRLIAQLLAVGAIRDERNLYWAIRPHAVYPTLEFRIMDVCPRVDDAVAIAALTRALVAAAAEGDLREPHDDGFSVGAWQTALASNEWAVTRFGLDAIVIDPAAADHQTPIRTAIRQLVERLMPTAEALGDAHALERVEVILNRGNGADRMRAVARERGGLEALVRWLVGETLLGTGVDRRFAQREVSA